MLLAIALTAFAGVPPSPCAIDLRLEPGRRWTYEGRALWSVGGSAVADSGPVRWTMTVMETRNVGGTLVALVRGLFLELAWYEPGTAPRLSLLICDGPRLDAVRPPDDEEARVMFRGWPMPARSERLLELPLEPGRVFGQDPPRSDHLYGWAVSDVPTDSTAGPPPSCPSPTGPARELAYWSLSGHAIVQWQPGVGATRFGYAHHGSPAATDVRLITCGGGDGEG